MMRSVVWALCLTGCFALPAGTEAPRSVIYVGDFTRGVARPSLCPDGWEGLASATDLEKFDVRFEATCLSPHPVTTFEMAGDCPEGAELVGANLYGSICTLPGPVRDDVWFHGVAYGPSKADEALCTTDGWSRLEAEGRPRGSLHCLAPEGLRVVALDRVQTPDPICPTGWDPLLARDGQRLVCGKRNGGDLMARSYRTDGETPVSARLELACPDGWTLLGGVNPETGFYAYANRNYFYDDNWQYVCEAPGRGSAFLGPRTDLPPRVSQNGRCPEGWLIYGYTENDVVCWLPSETL